jgi:diguanylate cyclase (GGDEF)-like protein
MPEDRETPDGIIGVDQTVERSDSSRTLYNKEIRFIKGLQTIIGEIEGRTLVCNYSYDALQDFVKFDTLGLLVCTGDSVEVCLCTGGSTSQEEIDFMQSMLMSLLPSSIRETRPSRTIVLGELGHKPFEPAQAGTVVATLGTQEDGKGFIAIAREGFPFSQREERVFKRLCSHIALALEKIELFDRVTELAITDGLTGIFNHLHIVTKLEGEVARSRRYRSNLSVILFDIDNFKDVNDRYGHLAGDQVLIRVAQLIKNSVRNIDAVGRYGGEEFLAVLPETDGEAALTMAERVRSRIQDEYFVYEDQVIRLTLSGGVADYTNETEASKLIRIADDNLLAAKKQGKNMVLYEKS